MFNVNANDQYKKFKTNFHTNILKVGLYLWSIYRAIVDFKMQQ